MISKEELERGIRATEARLAEARKDPLVIREIEEARAEQTAYQIMESLMSSARFRPAGKKRRKPTARASA